MMDPSVDSIVMEMKGIKGVIDSKVICERRAQVTVSAEAYHSVVETLQKKGFAHIAAMTCIDSGENLELLLQIGRRAIVTVKVILPAQTPSIDSVSDILPPASFHEREIHDLFGVEFRNCPDSSRLMLPEEWPKGTFPLRKSFQPETPAPLRGP
ncbi:MAG: NADH-quinone oxidoreductase subunit C [Candidatus Methanomethylicia archaeon]|nr:NADH-quinone oxidoreductase subunit C [Candidatus Methanomethylicia archaeon]